MQERKKYLNVNTWVSWVKSLVFRSHSIMSVLSDDRVECVKLTLRDALTQPPCLSTSSAARITQLAMLRSGPSILWLMFTAMDSAESALPAYTEKARRKSHAVVLQQHFVNVMFLHRFVIYHCYADQKNKRLKKKKTLSGFDIFESTGKPCCCNSQFSSSRCCSF